MDSSNKKLALILHGFPGLTKKDPIRKYFKSRGYDVLLPDLFGNSFEFNQKNLTNLVEKSLGQKSPQVVLGTSLGGFIAPAIARKYPRSKLIMIATGSHIAVGIPIYLKLVRKGDTKLLRLILYLSKLMNKGFYKVIYKVYNPFISKAQIKSYYKENVFETFDMFKKISISKILEIINFIRRLDNEKLLKSLRNETLIICGERDIMMPKELSYELKSLIKNSELLISDKRLHYDVFDERDFEKVDKFLGMKLKSSNS